MDPQLWKINTQPASEFARDLSLTLVNQAPDRLTFNADGQPFDSVALYNYRDPISLYKDTVRWFEGVVLSGPRFGSPTSESHDYEVAGLWWYLEQLVFEQEWRTGVSSLHKGHVILGRDIDNDSVSVGVVIKEVLDYAIAAGAPFAYAQADLDLLTAVPPTDEQTDLACSEAVTKMLRWVPDTTTWFDYSAATPVLHFTRRAAAAVVQYDCTAGAPAEQIEILRRDDLVQSGVIINYERVDTVDGVRYPALHTDIWPPAGVTSGFDTASFTINIAGSQSTSQSVEIEVGSYNASVILQQQHPQISGALLEPLSSSGNIGGILLSGSVPAWTGRSTSEATITAKATWVDPDGTTHTKEDVSATVMTTDASSQTYTRETSYTEADPIPVGLAQALYEAISQVHFQGRFNLLESESTGGLHPGMVLNLSGGLAEWAAMRAAIQQVGFDFDTGRTSITFGPPEHLSPQDHIALLNANRRRITQFSGDSRATGSASGGGDVAMGGASNNSSGSTGLRLSKLVLKDAGETKTISIDTAEIVKGKALVCETDGSMKLDFLKWR